MVRLSVGSISGQVLPGLSSATAAVAAVDRRTMDFLTPPPAQLKGIEGQARMNGFLFYLGRRIVSWDLSRGGVGWHRTIVIPAGAAPALLVPFSAEEAGGRRYDQCCLTLLWPGASWRPMPEALVRWQHPTCVHGACRARAVAVGCFADTILSSCVPAPVKLVHNLCPGLLQALYRHHDAHTVFIGFLSDGATALTVDQRGCLAIWPQVSSQLIFTLLYPSGYWALTWVLSLWTHW